ncbi:alpha/beta hydrolase [uncultured Roseibium sp.]|uniref:alpha/beta fold hydrolase n=1 Tax=uncultured Roseibium sp. TaxID=1936171 RepID=UPI0032162C8E
MTVQTHISGGIEYLERPAQGEGPVLVLLHGIGSNAMSFAPFLDHIAPTFRVIVWNAPGYGGSEPLAKDWPQAADYAEALKGLLDRLGLDRVLLVGHSLGTLIGAAFAAGYPDRVAHLLLASPALGHGVTPGSALSAAAQKRLDDLAALGAEKFAEARASRLVFEPETNPDLVARVFDAMSRVSSPGYDMAVRMLASGRLLDDAARLTVPTDVIVGAEDVVTPPEAARKTHAAIPQSARGALTEVPSAGHALYQQAPEAFALALASMTSPAQ